MSKEELQVTWEDQKRINEFSVLTSRCENNSTEAAYLAGEVEVAKDALRELEMVLDEDEPIMYRCGSGFCALAFGNVVNRITADKESKQRRLANVRSQLSQDEERSIVLKKILQSKFGDAIQLEQ